MQALFVDDVIVMQRREYEAQGLNAPILTIIPFLAWCRCVKVLFPTIDAAVRLRQNSSTLLTL